MLGEKYHDEHDQFDHLHVSSRSVAFDEEYTLGQELGMVKPPGQPSREARAHTAGFKVIVDGWVQRLVQWKGVARRAAWRGLAPRALGSRRTPRE